VARPSTYSIVATDLERGEWGAAVQSKFLAVGSLVISAEVAVGAIATQAFMNPRYGPDGLALLRQGRSATEVVEELTAGDEGRADRQLGIVDGQGGAANYTGSKCFEWAGGRMGRGYAAQGNILVSGDTVDALAETFEQGEGHPLAERLVACLQAAQRAGGDRRGQQSAAVLVVQKDAGYAGLSDVQVDLRVDDHERPIDELERLLALQELYFGQTPPEDWLDVDEGLRDELRDGLARLGYEQESLAEAFRAWTGTENLEDRVKGLDRIDPVVLAELRKRQA
jgi:uncharacterized Ntn-hydrolase superfamily protein